MPVLMPSGNNIIQMAELCTDVESLRYAQESLSKQIKKTKSRDYDEVMTNWQMMTAFAEYRELAKVDPWSGDVAGVTEFNPPGAITNADYVGQESLKKLDQKESLTQLSFVYDIDENSRVLTGYFTPDDQPVSAASKEVLDRGFESWLEANNMHLSKEAIIYSTNKKNEQGEYTEKVSPSEFREIVENKNTAFRTMKKIDPRIRIETVQNLNDYTAARQERMTSTKPDQNAGVGAGAAGG